MLKTTGSPDKPAPSRNDSSKSVSSRNDNSRPASRRNDNNSEVDGVGIGRNGMQHAKKSGKTSKSRKLSKPGKSKSEKTFKSWNSAKSGKKLSKNGNSTNFDATKDKSKFLTPNAMTASNRLRLVFTEASILWHFDAECYIRIETDVLGYAIGVILSQLTSKTNPDGVVIKSDFG